MDSIITAFEENLGPVLMRKLLRTLEVAGGTHTVADLAEEVLSGRMQMFQGERSLVITQVAIWPRFRDLHCFIVCGDLGEIFGSLLARVKAFGVEQGCKRLTGCGRHGWTKVGVKVGFTTPYSTICMPLTAGTEV